MQVTHILLASIPVEMDTICIPHSSQTVTNWHEYELVIKGGHFLAEVMGKLERDPIEM